MSLDLTGKHLIAGDWLKGDRDFMSSPATGEAHRFAAGRVEDVEAACAGAEDASWSYAATSREERAAFLEVIAEEIEARGSAITEIGSSETGLPAARLEGERGRTVGQLRLFADHIRKGAYLDVRHDDALPDRLPLPRPELWMMQQPIGPVAVFGASNFPLAFSVAGGDTASALAAGCPVVVKGHSAHPGTSEIVAQAIDAARKRCGLHPGVFSLIQGGNRQVGEALVKHPSIRAVGFTGSLFGGRALFDLCAQRPDPIPFFGELGSVNPVFLLPNALKDRTEAIAKGWAASLTMGAGQFCTNPGIVIAVDGPVADAFTTATLEALKPVGAQTMLTDGIAEAYRKGRDHLSTLGGVEHLLVQDAPARQVTPNLLSVSGSDFRAKPDLAEEVFGPLGLIVRVADEDEMVAVARGIKGQLTCTLHLDSGDTDLGRRLMPILTRKAGRVLANGFPTGVEVADAMVHGGPYPASTNFGATSVGTLSIRRWLRPVCYQNLPRAMLPLDVQNVQ